jgi:hypothetical protein
MVYQAVHPPIARSVDDGGSIGRLAGAGGLVFVVLLLVQNLVRASGPSFSATPATVTAYFADHRVAALAPLALFPLGLVAILCFAAGIRSRARGTNARWYADLGALAVVVLAGLFSLVNIVEIVIAAAGTNLTAAPQLIQALWTLHSAAFGLNLAAIAASLAGLSQAARGAGLIPRWLALLALPGSACLFAAAVGTVAIAEGARWIYLGYAGFAIWAIFLIVASLTLVGLRSGELSAGNDQ